MSLFLLAVVVLLVIGAVAGFGIALARSSTRSYAEQGQLVPGEDSGAPASWAGSHTPEAKLHRRLVEVVRALRTMGERTDEDVSTLEMRVELEQHAREVDRRLIAAAALPDVARQPAIASAEQAVVAVERALATLVEQSGLAGGGADQRGLAGLEEQIRLAAQARAELEEVALDEDLTAGGSPGPATAVEEPEPGTSEPGTSEPGTA